MLLGHYGASPLGKTLRRPIIRTMSSYEGTSTFATDAMRSTMGMLRGGRALSAAARSSPPPLHKTWQATHGIVFNSNPTLGQARPLNTAALADIEQDLILLSSTEDDYVPAGMEMASMECEESIKQSPTVKTVSVIEEVVQEDPEQNTLPETTFSYKMTEDLFRAAKRAVPLSCDSYWLHTLYRGPSAEGEGKKVAVHYCQSKHTTENVLQKYFMDQKVIGFDIEWKLEATRYSGPKKNVSLIQIASEERIALLHVALYAKDEISDLVAPSLKKLMEDPEISKVGVSIKADCTRLRRYLNIDSQGIFELSHLYKLVKFSESKDFKLVNKRLVSLATQVQEHLHLPMFKGEVRSSDWSKKLNMDQITYAAADSYAGIQLFNVMELKRKALNPAPPRPYHAELNKAIRLAEGAELPVDEAAEELEPEDAEPTPLSKRSNSKPTLENLPRSEVEADPDADFEPSQDLQTSSSTPPTTRSKAPPAPKPAKHPLLVIAEIHVSTYRNSTADSTLTHRATPANLRAYYLWILNPSLTMPEIAGVMRSPPLQTRTVAHYILEAVKLEELKYEDEKVKDVLSFWKKAGGSKGAMAKRYWKLERDVGFVDKDDGK